MKFHKSKILTLRTYWRRQDSSKRGILSMLWRCCVLSLLLLEKVGDGR